MLLPACAGEGIPPPLQASIQSDDSFKAAIDCYSALILRVSATPINDTPALDHAAATRDRRRAARSLAGDGFRTLVPTPGTEPWFCYFPPGMLHIQASTIGEGIKTGLLPPGMDMDVPTNNYCWRALLVVLACTVAASAAQNRP